MMGISLFGTCTMKYNARVSEAVAQRPELAEVHPLQPEDTLQGILEIIHAFDLILRELSGMDQFIFQAGGGADAAYTHCVRHARLSPGARRAGAAQRDHHLDPGPSLQCGDRRGRRLQGRHAACWRRTAIPRLEALKAALSPRTAALLHQQSRRHGHLQSRTSRNGCGSSTRRAGSCFYDHANFNGVMGKLRARELGFDACMYMLHKTFGAPKGGGGPAVGAYGCSAELAPFLPTPVVVQRGRRAIASTTTGRRAPARSASSGAMCRRC